MSIFSFVCASLCSVWWMCVILGIATCSSDQEAAAATRTHRLEWNASVSAMYPPE